MPKIGRMTYPDDPLQILADRNIGALYKAFLTKSFSNDDVAFLQGRLNIKKTYKVYFAKNARNKLNLTSKMFTDAQALADAGDWKLSSWKQLLLEISTSLTETLALNYNARFYKSNTFRQAHALILAKKNANWFAKKFRTKNYKAIENAIRALALSQKNDALKFIAEMHKKEELENEWMAQMAPETLTKAIAKKLDL